MQNAGVDFNQRRVGVLGASSFVGTALLAHLWEMNWKVLAFSRKPVTQNQAVAEWVELNLQICEPKIKISHWVSLCPLEVLIELLPFLQDCGIRRLVAVSSTSRFTKAKSIDLAERKLSQALAEGEEKLEGWATQRGISLTILRPTLIYDGMQDRNITAIARFVRRHGYFPVLGAASGLRQPIHARDVACACAAALALDQTALAYNLSGGETISYREMVKRIFGSLQMSERLMSVPLWIVHFAVPFLKLHPRFRDFSVGVFNRMNEDLAFDHSAAALDLDFKPRSFHLPESFFKFE